MIIECLCHFEHKNDNGNYGFLNYTSDMHLGHTRFLFFKFMSWYFIQKRDGGNICNAVVYFYYYKDMFLALLQIQVDIKVKYCNVFLKSKL